MGWPTTPTRKATPQAATTRDVNLSREGDVLTAYQATISEGMVADQVTILNRSLLLELWPELILSSRVRNLRESRFPEDPG
jgi:hypothetical protein